MDLATRQRIFSASVTANQGVLVPFILTLVDHHNRMRNGSGTLLKIGRHVFIATAAHLIPNQPSGRLWPLTREIRHQGDGFPAYSSFGRHPKYDVGYLEVDPEGAETYFGEREYATMEQVAIRGCGREDKSVILVGAPAEHAEVTRDSKTTATYKANVMTYWTVPLMPSEWPKVPPDACPADEAVDIFLNYPSDGVISIDGEQDATLPDPSGMSGGGVWDQEFNSGEVWSPAAMKLIGIQSRWQSEGRYLRVIQIQHLLHLIYRDYPDIRSDLAERFGGAMEKSI